jgi:transcription initiation factor IIE alpha subunit
VLQTELKKLKVEAENALPGNGFQANEAGKKEMQETQMSLGSQEIRQSNTKTSHGSKASGPAGP